MKFKKGQRVVFINTTACMIIPYGAQGVILNDDYTTHSSFPICVKFDNNIICGNYNHGRVIWCNENSLRRINIPNTQLCFEFMKMKFMR